jgi:hypothetical protein
MLLGLALAGCMAAAPAYAQDNATPDNQHLGTNPVERGAIDRPDDMNMDPAMIPDPAPLSYPFAAPASLNVQHWTDYNRNELAPGSVNTVRYNKEKMRRRRFDDRDQTRYGNQPEGQPMYYRRMDNDTSNYDRVSAYDRGLDNAMWTTRQPAIAAGGDYVYVLQGPTLYQLRLADMSLVTQKDLPMPSADMGAATGTSSNSTGASSSASVLTPNTSTDSTRNSVSGTDNGTATSGTNSTSAATGNTGTDTSGATNNSTSANNQTGTDNNAAGTNANPNSATNQSNTGTDNSAATSNPTGTPNNPGVNNAAPATSNNPPMMGYGRMMGGRAAITVSSDGNNVFVVRGNTVYQFRASDLSLVSQKILPIPSMGAGTSGYGAGSVGAGTPGSNTGNTTNPGTGGTSGTSTGTGQQ